MANHYHTSSHSKYLLQTHLVFSTKYRKKLLVGALKDDLKQILYDIANEKDITIIAMEADGDHIHLMVDYPPTKSVVEMVNNFKSISTFRIYKKHRAFLKTHYWKENTLFSDGYFACSIGEASPETMKSGAKKILSIPRKKECLLENLRQIYLSGSRNPPALAGG